MSLWWPYLLAFGGAALGLALACALSPAIRKGFIGGCLFPIGYRLYTGVAGYTLHKRNLMSSAANPRTPHTIVEAVKTYGEGDAAVMVLPIPLLEDNYSYLLLHVASKTAALVDPADPYPVVQVLEQHPEYRLTHILTTHKHWDHAGGNLELLKSYPSLVVIGGTGEGAAGVTRECTTGDTVEIAPRFAADVYMCPCHTKGHVVFRVNQQLLFTGDTLFAGGCGKFFEGNAAQMHHNLYETLGFLPDATLVHPGHEYTKSNLEFAHWVEPDNEACKAKLEWSTERRAGKFPTIPTTMGEERSYNPFLRVSEPAVVARVARVLGLTNVSASNSGLRDQCVRVMDALRTLKNENAHQKKAHETVDASKNT